jgi:hypothetical protein
LTTGPYLGYQRLTARVLNLYAKLGIPREQIDDEYERLREHSENDS